MTVMNVQQKAQYRRRRDSLVWILAALPAPAAGAAVGAGFGYNHPILIIGAPIIYLIFAITIWQLSYKNLEKAKALCLVQTVACVLVAVADAAATQIVLPTAVWALYSASAAVFGADLLLIRRLKRVAATA